MVVDDLDVVGFTVLPHEAESHLVVDSNAVLPCSMVMFASVTRA